MNGSPCPKSGAGERFDCAPTRASWLSFIDPHANERCSLPPAAAKPHSAFVGKRPPSQTQNANSTCHGTQLSALASRASRVFSARTFVLPPLVLFTFASSAGV